MTRWMRLQKSSWEENKMAYNGNARTMFLKNYEESSHSCWSHRRHPVEGKPGDPKARHTCIECGRKTYEENMTPTEQVAFNKFKAWLLWKCKECKPRRSHKW